MAKPAVTIAEEIAAILKNRDGQTSGQLLHELSKSRPGITKATVHPILSRMGRDRMAFRHLGVWYQWPECAR